MKDNATYNILIVDDEPEYQNVVSIILNDAGYSTAACSNGKEALAFLAEHEVNLVITDLKMPVMSGDVLISKIRELGYELDIIVVTAYGSIESAVEAMRGGATDYFVKSADPDELIMKIDRIMEMKRLRRRGEILLKNQNEVDVFMDSKSIKYRQLIDMCNRTADTNINILLLGESGVGKEIIANYIHSVSDRANEPFIPVNCQEFPEALIESELFGHERGAFTGAVGSRIGKFEEANYGTLFIDEIGDLPLSTQGKLLRVLETRTIERIGSNKRIGLDIRFIFATNKDLMKEIELGKFRDDLLYRINTLTLTIPALKDRREDLPGLIDFFIKKIAVDQKKRNIFVEPEVIEQLINYDYPGNVRELKNIVERMIALSRNGRVTLNEIQIPLSKGINGESDYADDAFTLKEAREKFEKNYIENALRQNNGNVSKTAEKLQLSARQLWNKISAYSISLKKR